MPKKKKRDNIIKMTLCPNCRTIQKVGTICGICRCKIKDPDEKEEEESEDP